MKSFSDYIVNVKQLKNNVDNIKSNIGKCVKFCAVVKANAYGLGLETICKSISNKVDFFAVACIKEALQIREFDKCTKILILGFVDKDSLKLCVDNNISISVSNINQLKECSELENKISIHLQLNTGLNRFGFRSVIEFKKALRFINKNTNIILEGVYSHLATKSNDVLYMRKQLFRFIQFKGLVKTNGVIFHISNSYATICDEVFRFNMVRNGFLLYGGMENDIGNKLVLTIKSKLINIFNVKKGDTIGYDRTFKVSKNMTIGVVPMGYADGFDRRLSNNFNVLINGKRCRVIGLVCMDVFMVDLTGIKAKLYDEVVILGKQKDLQITLQDYANALNTSPYEILLKFNYKRMNYILKN